MSKKFLLISVLVFAMLHAAALDIVCTSYPVWLLTRSITAQASGVNLKLMMHANSGCSHTYTPSPQDMRLIAGKNVVLICNGRGTDEHIVAAARKVNPRVRIITAAEAIVSPDSHTFASPHTARDMCLKIAAGLSLLDPANQTLYDRNLHEFVQQLDGLIQQFRDLQLNGICVVLQNSVFINLSDLCQCKTILLKHENSDVMRAGELIRHLKSARTSHARNIWHEPHAHDATVKLFAQESRLPGVELDLLMHGPEDPPPSAASRTSSP